MKLSRLLELHNKSTQPLGLAKNLGDSFLLENNHLYKLIRKKTVEFDFKYSHEPNSSYLALPLSQLENILKTKTIPYIDNVSVLDGIKDSAVWDDITDNLKKNNVFHESCHAIARTISSTFFGPQENTETTIVRLMIEESFANSCELLGIIDVEDSAQRIFYETNSYIFMHDDRFQLKKMVGQIGFQCSIQFLILSYLFSNFLRERISDSDLERMQKIAGISNNPAIEIKNLRSVAKIAFELNPRFRWVTTAFYLKLNGINYSNQQLQQLNFLSLLESQSQFRLLLETLSAIGIL